MKKKINYRRIGRSNTVPMRSDAKFANECREMQLQRIKIGKDKKMTPSPRITLAMTRHPLFSQIKRDIIEADLP